MHQLQSDLVELCRNTSVQLTAQLQSVDNQLASLAADGTSTPLSSLSQSLQHLEELHSNGQVQSLAQAVSSQQTLVDTSRELLGQLQQQLAALRAQDASTPYPQQMLQWLQSMATSLGRKEKELRMARTQLDFLEQQCKEVSAQRQRLLQLQSDVTPSPSVQSLRRKVEEAREKTKERRETAKAMIKRLDQMAANDLLVRLAVRRVDQANPKEAVIKMVQATGHSATEAMTLLIRTCASLQQATGELESEQQKDPRFTEQKMLSENVTQADKLFSSLSETMKVMAGECQEAVAVLRKAMSDVHRYVMSNKKSSAESVVESSENMSPTRGWECNICGIVNDDAKTVCEGCFQRRILRVCLTNCCCVVSEMCHFKTMDKNNHTKSLSCNEQIDHSSSPQLFTLLLHRSEKDIC